MKTPLGKWWSSNCTVHGSHWPRVHGTMIHHIRPLSWSGPDIASNKVEVCPTGHTNIHILLDLLSDRRGVPLTDETKGFSRGEIALAQRGYDEWAATGFVPRK